MTRIMPPMPSGIASSSCGVSVHGAGRTFAPGRARLDDGFVNRSLAMLSEIVIRAHPVGRRLDPADERQLARCCYALAWFEEVFRAGVEINSPLFAIRSSEPSALLDSVPDVAIADLCALSWAFHDRFADLLGKRAVLNPSFAGSRDVGGADADLILDGCLIDIKTTKSPRLDTTWLYQLLGYLLLDYRDEYAIRSLGIYHSRQRALLKWDVAEFVSMVSETPRELACLRAALRLTIQTSLPANCGTRVAASV